MHLEDDALSMFKRHGTCMYAKVRKTVEETHRTNVFCSFNGVLLLKGKVSLDSGLMSSNKHLLEACLFASQLKNFINYY